METTDNNIVDVSKFSELIIAYRAARTLNRQLLHPQGCRCHHNVFAVVDGHPEHRSNWHLFWTEESRLAMVADDSWLSHYAYDAERTLKLMVRNSVTVINSKAKHCNATLDRSDDILLIMLSRDACCGWRASLIKLAWPTR